MKSNGLDSMFKDKRLVLALAVCGLVACQAPVTTLSQAELTASAQRGNAEAQYQLAKQLAAQKKYPEAMKWMQQSVTETQRAATRERRAAAALQVGDWYQAGLGEPKNTPAARRWWNTASRLGNGEAGYRLGMDCQAQHQGKLVAACLDDVEPSATMGYAPSQLMMAQWYASRTGGEAEAVTWLQKAAERDNRDAQYQLAQRYERGSGVAVRHDIAERWYFRAATLGQPQAQLWMAQHEDGQNALAWYQRAAMNDEPAAQLWLGKAYREGTWLPMDGQKSHDWLTRAAAGGSGEASYLLSQQQPRHDGREQLLQQSSAAGYARAQRELGDVFFKRNELERAREEYAKAAMAGDTTARVAYADMLRLGQGGKADYAAAAKQYWLAAQTGNRMAQYRMGMMRQDGMGVSRNRVHAYAWYALAATEGMHDAIHARNDLEAVMQPGEINAGQRLALHWSSGKMDE